jgi:membrane protein YqaA with SNARE-associated domain
MKYLFKNKKTFIFSAILGSFIVSSLITLILFPQIEGWVVFFFYVLISNSFIGIPHEPLFIYYGKIYPIYIPLLISIVPTIMGCALDYIILTPVLESKYLQKALKTKIFRKSALYFKKTPFMTLFVFALTPIPFYPVRILSVATKYPFKKFAASVTLGRIPRYAVLAYGGMALNIPNWIIITIFVLMVGSPFLVKYFKKFYKAGFVLLFQKKSGAEQVDQQEDAVIKPFEQT